MINFAYTRFDNSSSNEWAWLIGLFVFALAIRCVGLFWGGIHADENIGDAARVLTGQLIPVSHYYPPLLKYLTAAGYVLLFGFGLLTSLWSNAAEFRAAYFANPDLFLVVLRLVVSIAGAATAPLAAMIAGRLGVSKVGSILVGFAIALLPLSVWRSLIGKPDLGVAAGALLVVWATLRYTQELRRSDAMWFGAACAIAMSFKHSAVFIIGPLGLALLLLARRQGQPWSQLGRDALVAGGVAFLLWLPLNLGLWLDFQNFLEFQKVQRAMSTRDSTFIQTGEALWRLFGDRFSGPTLLLLAGFIVAPLWWRRPDVLLVWISVLISVGIVAVISGDRALVQLYLPQSVIIATFGVIALVRLAEQSGTRRWLGMVLAATAIGVLIFGSIEVKQQALAPSVRDRIAQTLRAVEGIDKRKIMASDLRQTGLPVSGDAEREDMARHARLADHYGVTLPKRYRPFAPNENRYFVRSLPWVIGGLEIYEAKDVKHVKPFAWPLQPEEWQLDYWLKQGYSVFVIKNEGEMLNAKVPAYRRLHEEIRDRGQLVATITADRPLFLEFETKVYLLRPQANSADSK